MISRLASQIPASQTLLINRRAKAMQAAGREVFNLGAGEPYWGTPEPILEAAERAMRDGFTRYGPTQGFPSLREKVAEYAKKYLGLSYSLGEIIVSSGAKQSVFLSLMALLNPGEKAILPKPYWVSYPQMIRMCGGEPLEIEASYEEKFALPADRLNEIAAQAKVLILNNPCNPTGMMLNQEQLKAIAEVVERHKLFVIADEIYEAFTLSDLPFVSFASLLSEEARQRTLTIFGVSKTFAMTGWRIGFTLGNEKIIGAMCRLQGHQSSCANTIAQKASEVALSLGREIIGKQIQEVRDGAEIAMKLLGSASSFVRIIPPLGAFYLFPDVSEVVRVSREIGKKIDTVADFAVQLLEAEGVSAVPGSAFGEERGIRLCLAIRGKELEEGLRRIKRFIEECVQR